MPRTWSLDGVIVDVAAAEALADGAANGGRVATVIDAVAIVECSRRRRCCRKRKQYSKCSQRYENPTRMRGTYINSPVMFECTSGSGQRIHESTALHSNRLVSSVRSSVTRSESK